MKKLENFKWDPSWISNLGCAKGCLDYLGVDITKSWLFGGTGYAFIINIGTDVCPSGPTAWNTSMLFELSKNLGYVVEGVFGHKHDKKNDFAQVQQRAWQLVRDAIDQGLPCYGWELAIPEFYVIYGYDDVGYYYAGPGADDGAGPKPWQELGNTDIGIVEVYRVKPGQASDDKTTVRQALAFALEHAQNPSKWIMPDYTAGLAGFDAWIDAVETGAPPMLGMSFNAEAWRECRALGVAFLEEAKGRLGDGMGTHFDEAIDRYKAVANYLETVTGQYPFSPSEDAIGVDDRSRAAVKALKKAREAEAAGLQALEEIVSVLGG
jgi:hypothetical protein